MFNLTATNETITNTNINPKQQNQVIEKNPSGVSPGLYAFDVSLSSTMTVSVLPSLYSSIISERQEFGDWMPYITGSFQPSRTLVVIWLELSKGSG